MRWSAPLPFPFPGPLAGEALGGRDLCLEHRGHERVHLERAQQSDAGNTFRDRDLDAIIDENSPCGSSP